MTTIKEETQKILDLKIKEIEDYKNLMIWIDELPDEIKNLRGNAFTGVTNLYDYGLTFWKFENRDIDIIKVLKIAGVQGLKLSMQSKDSWIAVGEFMVNNKKVHVNVYCLPTPETCHIEEYEVTEKRYRAICNQTGEEVGV